MIIEINGISFSYNSEPVLNNVTFGIERGEMCAIIGKNGAGKSTLLRCIDRILKPKNGVILIDGKDINELSRIEIAKKIGYIPQRSDSVNVTVFDAVLLGRKPYIKWDITERDVEITLKVLRTLDLEYLAFRSVEELSGGEFQKVLIARALVQEPKVLLLDEPTSNLDMKNQIEVMDLIKSVTRTRQIATVVVMHELNIALRYADKFLLLRDGNIFSYGGKEVVSEENIEKLFDVPVIIKMVDGYPVVIPVSEKDLLKVPVYI